MFIQIKRLKKLLREYLDTAFIKTAKFRVSDFDYVNEGRKALKDLRICLVKQEVFMDLYTKPELQGKDLLFSTIHRSGPIGLFESTAFDFFIVKVSQSEESRIWKFLKDDMNGPTEEEILSFKDQSVIKGSGEMVNRVSQSNVAVSMDEISWVNYDVVISINFSVDEKIVKKNTSILWCYMLQEPSMRHYKRSIDQVLFSYDIFLNQKFTYQIAKQKKHEVNFPYNLMNAHTFGDLTKINFENRQGVFIEIHSVSNVSPDQMKLLSQFGEVTFPKEELFERVLTKMMKSKYFFSLRGKHLSFKIWGNSMIDAVGAGLLAFGDPNEYHNIGLFTPFTIITSLEEAINKIELLERNPAVYEQERILQQKLLNKYCFYNPIKKLNNAYYKKQMA